MLPSIDNGLEYSHTQATTLSRIDNKGVHLHHSEEMRETNPDISVNVPPTMRNNVDVKTYHSTACASRHDQE